MATVDTPQATGSELAVYDRVADPAAFMNAFGTAIFGSQMFGCESVAQGRILAMECAARRIPPLMLAERYHLIKGKLSMKADAMLADFCTRAGGHHRVVERSAERAAVELTNAGDARVFSLSWEEASQEPFVYEGKESAVAAALLAGKREALKVKAKYATPRARMQMLWARVVSDGVRTMAPEVCAGFYTPEEVSDFDMVRTAKPAASTAEPDETVIDVAIVPASPDAPPVDVMAVPTDIPQPPPAAAPVVSDVPKCPVPQPTLPADNLAEAEAQANAMGKTIQLQSDESIAAHQAVAAVPSPPVEVTAAPPKSLTGKATAEQTAEVKSLVVELQVNRERLAAMLQRVGAATVADMAAEHCQALIGVLRKQREKLQQAKQAPGNG